MFADGSLLCVSLTINICSFSYFGCGKLADLLRTKYADKNSFLTKVTEIHNQKPWLLGKTVTELLVTCVLLILSVVALSTTSVSVLPFSGNQTATLDSLVQTVLSANIGRYVYTSVQDGFLNQHLNHFKTDLIHHLVTMGAYIVFLVYKQNVFLSMAGLLMELNVIPIGIGRIVREMDRNSHLYRRVAIASCAFTMVSRGVIPIVFLAIALKQESPFTMRIAPLTVFFLCIVFFFVINFWMILQTISRVIKYSPCGPGEVNENTQNYVTVRNPMEPQTRDVHLPGDNGGSQSVTFSNLNYGYLKSYDNRNVCNNENDKINYSTKKVSKANLAYKGPKLHWTQVGTETDDVSNNSVDVVHNSFSRTRVHFQDEVDSPSRLSPLRLPPRNADNNNSNSRTSSTGGSCSTSLLSPPFISSHSTEPPASPNNTIVNLAETVDIPFTALGGVG